MATKPTETIDWAQGGSAAVVDPGAGKKALGWEPQEKPAAQHDNWIKRQIELWLEYLEDGDFSGPITMDNTLNVTGLITALSGAIVTGDYKWTGIKYHTVPMAAFAPIIPGTTNDSLDIVAGYYTSNPANASVLVPITGPEGARIESFSLQMNQDTAGTMSVRLKSINALGAVSLHGSLQSSTTTPGYVTLSETGMAITIDPDEGYFLDIDATHAGLVNIRGGAKIGIDWA